MYVDDTPVELASLEKLEQILIAQIKVFEKIIVMPKGQQRKVKGAICNVPVECDQTSSLLPCPPERSDIVLLIHNSEVMYTFKQQGLTLPYKPCNGLRQIIHCIKTYKLMLII